MSTPTQIKDRIVALYAQISGVTTSLDDYKPQDAPFTDDELPAAITWLLHVPTTRRWLTGGVYLERHVFRTEFLVTPCDNVDVLSPNTTEMETCEVFKHSVPYFFAQRPRLHGTALTEMVYDTELVSDGGIIKITRPGIAYWALAFTLPVLEEQTV